MKVAYRLVMIGGEASACGCHGGGPAQLDSGRGDALGFADSGGVLDSTSDGGSTAQEECRDGWCWMYPTPQGNPLTAITGFSPTDVWTIGRLGTIEHYDGTNWTESSLPSPKNQLLLHLFGVATDDLWAVGDGLFHWDGHTWKEIDTLETIFAIGGDNSADMWLATSSNAVAHWDGTALTPRTAPAISGQLLGFWASGTDVYTVSSSGGIAKWLGSSWGVIDGGSHSGNAAAFVSPTQVVLAANDGVAWFFDGNGWTSRSTPTTTTWTSVTARSLDDVWVTNGPQAAHWDGQQWTQGATGALGFTFTSAVWTDPSGAPWIATDRAEVLSQGNNAWTPHTTGLPNIVNVGGTSDMDIWVTTLTAGVVTGTRHWNGLSWTDVENPAEAARCVARDLWAATADDVWIALTCHSDGVNEFVPRRLMRWDGNAWSLVESLGSEDAPIGSAGFNAVWGSAPNNVYAVANTAVYRFNGTDWSQITDGPPGGTSVFGLGADDVYVGHGADLWHWNGMTWSSRTSPSSIVGGLETSTDSVWLGGTSSGSFFNGQFFVTEPFIGLPVGDTASVFVQSGATEAHYQGGISGTRTVTDAFFQQVDAWRSPSGKSYVVTDAGGSGGLVVHL